MTIPASAEPADNRGFLRLFRKISIDDRLLVGWSILLKLLLLVLGAKAVMVFDNRRVPGLHACLELWNRWDAHHYVEIARNGYSTAADLVVYPVLPTLIRFFTVVLRDELISAFAISTVALAVALLLFRRLVQLDEPAEVALRAGWFLLIFPTAYFLQIGYTESVFIALVFGSLWASRVDRWWIAGVLGMLAAMTRASGLALLPTLAVEAGYQFWQSKKWRWSWLWLLLVVAGFAVYLSVNRYVGGGFFAFVKARHDIFRTSYDWPWVGIMHALRDWHRHASQAVMVGGEELFFVTLTLVCAVFSWFRLRPSYATWITFNCIGFTSLSFIQSAPRYALVCFPIFLLFARWSSNRLLLGILTAWSLLFYAFFAILFARGWWAF